MQASRLSIPPNAAQNQEMADARGAGARRVVRVGREKEREEGTRGEERRKEKGKEEERMEGG